ncbi:type IIL restriction-modification enzyme MmeI [Bathymodiolus japonicus methanotrophic gill symbiont]|uniref:type IIL restriction-modification enzyme MmeI n=1 Tax=Bathymodiolus japonicus methanotrophic gill symbiont TaxID=113269 RepID=UPI003084187C
MRSRCGRRAFRASPIRCVGERIMATGVPEFREVAWRAWNIFLSRLLFCFFAEDTRIFKAGQFTNAIASHTAKDGKDLQAYLQKLFSVLNLQGRTDYPQFLQDFPYVNVIALQPDTGVFR